MAKQVLAKKHTFATKFANLTVTAFIVLVLASISLILTTSGYQKDWENKLLITVICWTITGIVALLLLVFLLVPIDIDKKYPEDAIIYDTQEKAFIVATGKEQVIFPIKEVTKVEANNATPWFASNFFTSDKTSIGAIKFVVESKEDGVEEVQSNTIENAFEVYRKIQAMVTILDIEEEEKE